MWLYHRVRSPNDADGMANSVVPDQTAPLGAVWSGSAQSHLGPHCLPRHICQKTKDHYGIFLSDRNFNHRFAEVSVCMDRSTFIFSSGAEKNLGEKKIEPSHEKRNISTVWFMILPTFMHRHPVGPDLLLFVWSFLYFPILCERTAQALSLHCSPLW